MRSTISEFSFGFAITDEIVRQQRPNITAAPSFPTLRAEGGSEGGYDVRLDRTSIPLFLQFKLVHNMVRGNCNETKAGDFNPPFFRMKLMPLKASQQHDLLVDLDNGINQVYYAAPLFTTQSHLNSFYLANTVLNNSIFIPPSVIGRLPDRNEHHLSFDSALRRIRLYSKEGKNLEFVFTGEQFTGRLVEMLNGRGKPLKDLLPVAYEQMQSIIAQRQLSNRNVVEKALGDSSLLEGTINMARYFFGCELIFIQSGDNS